MEEFKKQEELYKAKTFGTIQGHDIRMKICYLAMALSIHVQRWAKYFSERGHEIHIITFEQPDVEPNGINIHIVKMNKKYLYASFLYKILQFRKIINDIKPDIVHAHYVTKYGIIGALSGFHPFVVSAWGSDIWIDAKGWKRIPAKFVLKKADCVHCEAENMIGKLAELGADSHKIHRIYWGTDTHKYNPEQKSTQIREELGIGESPLIISSKPLEPIYNIESLIKSIPQVLRIVPYAKFVISGKGSREAELRQLTKSLDVSNNVLFTGFIPPEEFPKYLASADIYVCTSLSDGGLAVSTKEAMASGLPVIVTDFGDNGKWIENGKNGFVIPMKDPASLADRIVYLIQHKDIRIKFGDAGRKLVKEKFEYNDELEKMENIYKDLIKYKENVNKQ